MRTTRWARLLLPLAAAAVLLGGCGDDSPGDPVIAVPDFALVDVNPTSVTYDQAVSPRDYLQRVSAWYFGHAT